jgi:7-carboxy-7-deazaguanine synthase
VIEIQEVFGLTIEGEGTLVGAPGVYIRTGPTVQSKVMSVEDLMKDVESRCGNNPYLITISGGEPVLYEEIGDLLDRLHARNHSVKVETKAVKVPTWIDQVDIWSLSPDLSAPSWDVLQACIQAKAQDVHLKAGILTSEDVERAHDLSRAFSKVPFYLFPRHDEALQSLEDVNENLLRNYRWLVGEVLQREWTNVRVFPPAHRLLWGNAKGV